MNIHSQSHQSLQGLLLTAALGAAAMYVFDPDRGRRRRALARDKLRSLASDTTDLVNAAARDARFRARGAKVQALRPFKREGIPDDLVLIERVRARMGRVVSHPHAIQVGARTGRVVLSGPLLASEVEPLLEAVRTVWGVSEIEDHLVVHQRPESVPSLQGGVRRTRTRPARMQANWTPALRVAALAGGALLALYGMRHRTLAGLALAGMGLGLATRGATNVPIARITTYVERGVPSRKAALRREPPPHGQALH